MLTEVSIAAMRQSVEPQKRTPGQEKTAPAFSLGERQAYAKNRCRLMPSMGSAG